MAKTFEHHSGTLPFGQHLPLSQINGPTYVTAQLLVQHAAAALGDRVWSVSPDTFDLDVALQHWKLGTALQPRAGIASIIEGCKSQHPAFVTASSCLRLLLDPYRNLGLYSVAALNYDSQSGRIVPDFESVISAADEYGLTLLCSLSVHEIQHMSLLARLLATFGPSVLTYDGLLARQTARVVDVMDFARLQKTAEDCQTRLRSPESCLDVLNDELGTEYQAFEYHGSPTAETVIVAFGSSLDLVDFVNVRVYRPFWDQVFLAALPKSTRNLVVLGPNALYQDVLAAVFSTDISVRLGVRPTVSDHSNAERYDLWQTTHHHIGTVLAKAFATDSAFNITLNTDHDNLVLGGVSQTTVCKSRKTVICPSKADVVFVGDARLLDEFAIVDSIKEGGKLILQASSLDVACRQALAQKKVRLYILDPAAMIMISEDARYEPYLVQTAILRVIRPQVEDVGIEKLAALNGSRHIFRKIAQNLDRALSLVLPGDSVPNDSVPDNSIPNDSLSPDCQPPKSQNLERLNLPARVNPSAFAPREPAKSCELRPQVENGLLFKEALGTKQMSRPDTYVVHVRENRRLTPPSYERNIFHIEFDLGTSGLRYEIGEALGVHAENDRQQVLDFIQVYGLNPDEVVEMPAASGTAQRTIFQALMQEVDIFGRPPKKFYEDLSQFATDRRQRIDLRTLASPEGAKEFARRAEVDTVTFADILLEYSSAHPSFRDIVRLVSPMKRREYSIASCQKVTPTSVALMIVVVGWVDPRGRDRFGQATRYLRDLSVGQPVIVSVKPSVMRLPPQSTQPLIMAGLGTGLAPFRAFVQYRAWEKAQGKDIGAVLLYMGSRHQREEYCYGEEWEAYQAAGVITLLGRAFSRDQPHKVYIQDRMRETMGDIVTAYLCQQGSFYLCGPTWPVPDVTSVLEDAIALDAAAHQTTVDPRKEIDRLKDAARYVLEVY